MEILRDILAAVFTLGDTLGEGLVALTLGFAAKATGIGFLVGAVFMLIYGSVVPVSFQVEGLTVVSRRAGGDWRSMCYAVMLAGLVGASLGFAGVFSAIANFVGSAIQSGMMTGAGLILAIVAIDVFRGNWKIGLTSTVVAYVLFILIRNPDWGLIVALVGSVIAGVIAGRILRVYEPVVSNPEIEKVSLVPRSWRDIKTYLRKPNVIRAALAILALRTGTSIAYSGVDASLAGTTFNADHVNIAAGLGGFFSALFGGANVEPIISATAAAPHPMWAGILMMLLTGGILLFGLLPRWGRYVPTQAICGFLLVLGPMIVIPSNIEGILADPVPSAVAAGVTAATIDPFLGMVVGIFVRALMGVFGG